MVLPSNIGPRPTPVPPPVPTDVRKAEETTEKNPPKELEIAAVAVREAEAEAAAAKQAEAVAVKAAEAAEVAALRQSEVEKLARMEEQAFKLGTSAERMAGQTTTTLASIPGDTLHKQGKLAKALVPVTPIPPAPSPYRIDVPFANVNFIKLKRLGYRLPEVNFINQAKTIVPTKLVSAAVLVQTQKVAYDKFKDKMHPLLADSTSWLVAVSAENVVNIPISAIRHQMQTRRAETTVEAIRQVLKNKGPKGLYKAYPLNTIAGTAVNIGLNSVSPYLTSEVQKRVGSNFLTPLVTGAAGGLCALPFTLFTHNVNHYINEPYDQRSTRQIIGGLVRQGPRAMFDGLGRGARRIALVGAVYNSTVYGVRSGQEAVKVKHVERVKEKLPSLLQTDTDYWINSKLGSRGFAEYVRNSG